MWAILSKCLEHIRMLSHIIQKLVVTEIAEDLFLQLKGKSASETCNGKVKSQYICIH